jgi:hypothetical protein
MTFEAPTTSLPWKRLVAELAVIVAGVLMALAADAWWETRREREEAREYSERLLVDFQETRRRLRGAIAGETATLDSVSSVVARAHDGVFPSPDSLVLPMQFNQFEPLTGTLTALVESGDLRLIRDDSLRFELVAFLSLLEISEQFLSHTETMIFGNIERLTLGRARHSQSASRRATNRGSGWGEVDVRGVLNDPEIVGALQLQAGASQMRAFSLGRLEEPIERIIRLTEAQLK